MMKKTLSSKSQASLGSIATSRGDIRRTDLAEGISSN